MEIKDILGMLDIDFADAEAKRGAIEAIKAILDSRAMPPSGGFAMPGMNTELDVDPDLIQPSQKYNQSMDMEDDIEVEDEENLLQQVRQNTTEDEPDTADKPTDADSKSDSKSDSTSDDTDTDPVDTKADLASNQKTTDKSESNPDNIDDSADTEDDNSDTQSDDIPETSDQDEADSEGQGIDDIDSDDLESDDTTTTDDDFSEADDDSEADDATEADDDSSDPDADNTANTEADEEEENAFDTDDLIDDELSSTTKDPDSDLKYDARKIKRERVLAAAKNALDKAKAENKPNTLIRELEAAMRDLESLVEALKALRDITDEEFNRMVNRVFDAIDSLGDTDLSYTSDEERKLTAQAFKKDIESAETQAELSAEDVEKIRAEHQAIKAREKESAKYATKSRSAFRGFQDFLNSLYKAIALQVKTNEINQDSWSAISRRNSGEGVLRQGKRIEELPDSKIPVIDFYFDCSASWYDSDLEFGNKAVEQLIDMENDGKIKVNVYYFADNVHEDKNAARAEGGTGAWNEIIKNIIATNATNVIIMTDHDMEDWWNDMYRNGAMKYTVPGYVWYLWKNGENAPRLPRDLKGRGGVQQFAFDTSN